MNKDLVRGKTLRFTFDDGAMAGKTFEHSFGVDGMVAFHAVGDESQASDKPAHAPPTKYEIATIRDDLCAVSYLSSAGYTLTTVLDFATKTLVAFSSNEKMLAVQRGSFDEVAGSTSTKRTSEEHRGLHSPASRH